MMLQLTEKDFSLKNSASTTKQIKNNKLKKLFILHTTDNS